jgi:hypothetical protein
MKLSEKTLSILKNFSQFNDTILIRPGNLISTIAKDKSFFAFSLVPEQFEKEFAIYELGNFLSILSIFKEPDLDFDDKFVMIKENSSKIRYRYAESSMILAAPNKTIQMPDTLFSGTIKASDLASLVKSMGVLDLPKFSINCDGQDVFLSAINDKDIGSNQFHVKIGEHTEAFSFIFSRDYMRPIAGDYSIALSQTGLLQVTSPTVTYFYMGDSH